MDYKGQKNLILYRIVCLLCISLCPLYYYSIGGLGLYQLLGAMLVFSIILSGIVVRPLYLELDKCTFLLMLIAAQTVVSNIFQGTNWMQAIKIWSTALMIMLMPADKIMAKAIRPCMALSGTITGLYMLKSGIYFEGFRMTVSIGGVNQDPNWIAMLFLTPFCFALFCIFDEKINLIGKIIVIICGILSIYETILTGSRGALIGIIIALAVWAIYESKKSNLKGIIIVFVLTILMLALPSILNQYISVDILKRLQRASSGDSRLLIWSNLIHSFGKGNIFQIFFGRGDGACYRNLGIGAHNGLLEALYEFGILGFGIQLSFWISFLQIVRKYGEGIELAIVLALFFESLFSPIFDVIYFQMPLAATIVSIKARKKAENGTWKVLKL